ncbi:UDP-4-amino-4,6-dideoxy-N-acetyl-beta-L-altrosamine N-acetyltransferase [Halomonas sp. CH40]
MEKQLGKFRAIQNSDLELMLSWRNMPSVRRYMYTRHEITLEEHRLWWEKVCSRSDQQYFLYEYDSTPLGVVGFSQINNDDMNSSWAFYASPEAPRGTGSRMEYLALEKVFREMMLHKLYCEVLDFNGAVIKLHQKFGFSIEGTFREHHQVDGEYVDIIRLGILKGEWELIRESILKKLISQR